MCRFATPGLSVVCGSECRYISLSVDGLGELNSDSVTSCASATVTSISSSTGYACLYRPAVASAIDSDSCFAMIDFSDVSVRSHRGDRDPGPDRDNDRICVAASCDRDPALSSASAYFSCLPPTPPPTTTSPAFRLFLLPPQKKKKDKRK